MEAYDTMVEAINSLKLQGYVEDFNLRNNCLECRNGEFQIFHDEFHIDKQFRFEDNTDPDDQAILYAISSEKYQLKGILVNGYGIYSDELTNKMLEKLR
ncbi:MAG: phosphoribosylpyrophosphate synthetase [Sphingobacteriales bacterium]|nr:MAG: phosphoribosylpyrophosphate synthetase [Sphingobacteriales bacterium]